MDGEGDDFCEDNAMGCVIAGALLVGGVTWAIVDYSRSKSAPVAPVPGPPVQGPPPLL